MLSLVAGALATVAVHADEAGYEAIIDRFRNGRTPQEQVRHLYAAAAVRDDDLFGRYLALLDTTEVRSQNLAFAHRAAMRNRVHGARAWADVRDSWDELLDRLPSNSVNRLVEGIVVLDDPDVADEVAAFLAAHPVPQAAKHIEQAVERMRVSVDLRRREAGRLVTELP